MAEYSRLIAEQLGLVEAEQRMILNAAPMHDLGKIGIPDQILLKRGTLTPEEFEIMIEFGYHLGRRAYTTFRRKVVLDHGDDEPGVSGPQQRPFRRLLL